METRITPTTTRILKSPIRAELPAQYIQQLPSIQNLLLHLEGKGRSENTRTAYEKNLKALAIRTDLKDTKAVELIIARYKKKNGRPITNNYKSKLCDHYATYCKFYKIEWEKPIYTPEPTTIQPPTQEKISMLISSARLELSIKLERARTRSRTILINQNNSSPRTTHPRNATPLKPNPLTTMRAHRTTLSINLHNLSSSKPLITMRTSHVAKVVSSKTLTISQEATSFAYLRLMRPKGLGCKGQTDTLPIARIKSQEE